MRLASAALCIAISAGSPALACDLVPPPQVANDFKEKVPGWLVWKFTQQAGFQGHMLTGHFARSAFPGAAQERRFSRKRSAGPLRHCSTQDLPARHLMGLLPLYRRKISVSGRRPALSH